MSQPNNTQQEYFERILRAESFVPEQAAQLAHVLTQPLILSALREILLQSDNATGSIKAVDFSLPNAMISLAELKGKALGLDAALAILYNLTELTPQSATERKEDDQS